MSILYLGVEGSYKLFEIALFESEKLIQVVSGDKSSASSSFILSLHKILKDNKKKFEDLQFIAVDQGPGAFTSLRVIISTINALAFKATPSLERGEVSVPLLVGIDGLDALAYETYDLLNEKKIFQNYNDIHASSQTNFFIVSLLSTIVRTTFFYSCFFIYIVFCFLVKNIWTQWDLNPQPLPCKGSALPN